MDTLFRKNRRRLWGFGFDCLWEEQAEVAEVLIWHCPFGKNRRRLQRFGFDTVFGEEQAEVAEVGIWHCLWEEQVEVAEVWI